MENPIKMDDEMGYSPLGSLQIQLRKKRQEQEEAALACFSWKGGKHDSLRESNMSMENHL